jgi:hypothetical protein
MSAGRHTLALFCYMVTVDRVGCPNMSSTPSLLMFGHYVPLLKSRQSMLQRRGLPVHIVNSFTQMTPLISHGRLDLMVLCHTASFAECQYLLALVKTQQPEATTLLLLPRDCTCTALKASNVFNIRKGPQSFIDCVCRVSGLGTDDLKRRSQPRVEQTQVAAGQVSFDQWNRRPGGIFRLPRD